MTLTVTDTKPVKVDGRDVVLNVLTSPPDVIAASKTRLAMKVSPPNSGARSAASCIVQLAGVRPVSMVQA